MMILLTRCLCRLFIPAQISIKSNWWDEVAVRGGYEGSGTILRVCCKEWVGTKKDSGAIFREQAD
jgi:hypothetical protein